MARLLLTRLGLPTLFAASMILFIAINVVPGSAARSALGVDATPQAIMRFEALNDLNRPLVIQYTEWLERALHGDLGTSFQNRVPVAPEILKRLPTTLELAILAFLLAKAIALALGALAALRHRRRAFR
jgi:peptide/nickel transport system permease protein